MLNSEKEVINIYAGTEYIDSFRDNYVNINDHYFNNVKYDRDFLKDQNRIIKQIDGAEIIDYELLTVVTPYGTTSIDNFSTGLKTLLNTKYLIQNGGGEKYLINLNECGDKVVNIILKMTSKENISFLIERTIMLDAIIFKAFTVSINETPMYTPMEFMLFMLNWCEKSLQEFIKN